MKGGKEQRREINKRRGDRNNPVSISSEALVRVVVSLDLRQVFDGGGVTLIGPLLVGYAGSDILVSLSLNKQPLVRSRRYAEEDERISWRIKKTNN